MTIDYNRTHIHFVTVSVRNDKKLKSVTLPVQSSQINFFSVSLISADASVAAGAMEAEALASSGQQVLDSGAAPSAAPALSVQTVRSTTKWLGETTSKSARTQIIEVTINNVSPLNAPLAEWVTSNHSVSLVSSSLHTVTSGSFRRLRTNDQVTVVVGVQNSVGVASGSNATVTVVVKDKDGKEVALAGGAQAWPVVAGIPDYQNNDPSLDTHESPEWVCTDRSRLHEDVY